MRGVLGLLLLAGLALGGPLESAEIEGAADRVLSSGAYQRELPEAQVDATPDRSGSGDPAPGRRTTGERAPGPGATLALRSRAETPDRHAGRSR